MVKQLLRRPCTLQSVVGPWALDVILVGEAAFVKLMLSDVGKLGI